MYKQDPYLSDELCFRRLYSDYIKHNNIIIAVDFDNTIYDYHKKGRTFPKVINLLQRCNKIGFDIIIFTANTDYKFITNYCIEINLKITGINKNVLLEFKNSGKIYFNILLDDRAGLKSAYNQLSKLVDSIEKGENNED